jgi:two-component system, LytTR family, sensor histidine kinase AlgZ
LPTGSKSAFSVPTDQAPWLPDFCTLPVLGAVLLMAQLVVMVVLLAPGPQGLAWFSLQQFAAGSFLAYLVALSAALLLCLLRAPLLKIGPVVGALLALLVVALVAAGISALVFWLDFALETRVAVRHEGIGRMVLETSLLSGLVAAGALRYFYVREQWSAQVEAQARSQMDALQARINPHFLFNSMNTIASLIQIDPDLAERAVEDLSDLFRAALGTRPGPSTLGSEIELIQRYLSIEQLRLGQRLKVDWDIDSLPRQLEVPPLLLQPLVENAILHGIQALPEGGTVAIHGHVAGRMLAIEIRNPRPKASLDEPTSNRHAVDNIRQRIAYHFGERGTLEADAGEGYYACTVRLPLP